ncbi:hypothetical protein E2C01_028663 [Portunus trituberculatus]|uniref:Uncharacterized protein n=1 Tax=Portunus trituberculatus TaxID=210409 RepID=A0A5B7EPB7_PORTR|nr:hypothetical protein [Portunus trituberculatus]
MPRFSNPNHPQYPPRPQNTLVQSSAYDNIQQQVRYPPQSRSFMDVIMSCNSQSTLQAPLLMLRPVLPG